MKIKKKIFQLNSENLTTTNKSLIIFDSTTSLIDEYLLILLDALNTNLIYSQQQIIENPSIIMGQYNLFNQLKKIYIL